MLFDLKRMLLATSLPPLAMGRLVLNNTLEPTNIQYVNFHFLVIRLLSSLCFVSAHEPLPLVERSKA